jgi:hypothetical protein
MTQLIVVFTIVFERTGVQSESSQNTATQHLFINVVLLNCCDLVSFVEAFVFLKWASTLAAATVRHPKGGGILNRLVKHGVPSGNLHIIVANSMLGDMQLPD